MTTQQFGYNFNLCLPSAIHNEMRNCSYITSFANPLESQTTHFNEGEFVSIDIWSWNMVGDIDFEYQIDIEWDDIQTYHVRTTMLELAAMHQTSTSIVCCMETVMMD